MITTITGNNDFALKAFVDRKICSYTKDYGDLAIERFNADEADTDVLQEAMQSLPFLVPTKLLIIRNPSANKKFSEDLGIHLKLVPDNIDLLFVEPKFDKRSSIYKLLKSKTDFNEFNELDVVGLAKWLVSEAESQEARISINDARYLVERVGTNQMLLSNELKKLIANDRNVTRQVIDSLTTKSPQSSIFDLVESAFSGNTKRALDLYTEQRLQKVEPQQIIAMLAWQLHILALVKTAKGKSSAQIASDAKINPYVVTKTMNLARDISYSDVKLYISELFELDAMFKQVSMDTDAALQGYIMGLQKTPRG